MTTTAQEITLEKDRVTTSGRHTGVYFLSIQLFVHIFILGNMLHEVCFLKVFLINLKFIRNSEFLKKFKEIYSLSAGQMLVRLAHPQSQKNTISTPSSHACANLGMLISNF